jgi:NEDD8-activating enzyme E1
MAISCIASCCTEALKIATTAAPYLNNYFMLIGTEGVYSYTFEHERKPDCPVCGDNSKPATIPADYTVEQLIDWLLEKQDMLVTSVNDPLDDAPNEFISYHA